jgi:hypothetical protein
MVLHKPDLSQDHYLPSISLDKVLQHFQPGTPETGAGEPHGTNLVNQTRSGMRQTFRIEAL